MTFGLLVATAAACSPAQRQFVGGGMAAVGVGVTYVAIESMADSCPRDGEPRDACVDAHERASPTTALPVALGGLGIAFLGGLVIATSGHAQSAPASQPAPPPVAPRAPAAPPGTPAVLHRAEAVGMVVSRLVLRGMNGDHRPTKLLDVDDTQTSLSVEGGYAELQNLRVRTADGTWRTVGACYALESEWRLTSLGPAPQCPR